MWCWGERGRSPASEPSWVAWRVLIRRVTSPWCCAFRPVRLGHGSLEPGARSGDPERWLYSTPDAVAEDAITRELVDAVDPEVVRIAERNTCEVSFGGGVLCRKA